MEGEASYKKLNDGSWGIRTKGYVPDAGDTVDVTQKSGDVKQEEVSRVIWAGTTDDGDNTAICEIIKRDRDGNVVAKPKQQGNRQQQSSNKQQQSSGKQQCKCAGCGTTDPSKQYYCDECVVTGNTIASPPADEAGDGDTDEIPF